MKKQQYTPEQILSFYSEYNWITCDKLNGKKPLIKLWKIEPTLRELGDWWFPKGIEANFSEVTILDRPDIEVVWGTLRRFNKRKVAL